MAVGASSLDVMLRAIEVMTAWNDDFDLMGRVVAAQVADAGDDAIVELAVGFGHLCNVLLSRIELDSHYSKQELLQILAGVFIAEAARGDELPAGDVGNCA